MPNRTSLQHFFKDEDGAVAVEFVLIAPLLIALVFGILSFGYLFGVSHAVQQLAVETARVSVQGLTQAERLALAHANLDRATAQYPLLRPAHVTRDVQISAGNFGDVTVTIGYAIDGSMLDLANALFNLDIATLEGRAYLAY